MEEENPKRTSGAPNIQVPSMPDSSAKTPGPPLGIETSSTS